MITIINKIQCRLLILMISLPVCLWPQDKPDSTLEKASKPVRNVFESVYLLDNQSSVVPGKGTFQMDIQHRFGTVENGYSDFFGLYAPSNIRIGFSYSPIDRLYVGFGFAKINLTWDFSAKYALFQQMQDGGWPVSVTYYGNAAVDTRPEDNFENASDRLTYFNQLIISRKITSKLSVQVAPSFSHANAVEAYVNSSGEKQPTMKNDHFAIAFGGRYKISSQTSIMVNYDKPLTTHQTENPFPNISFGFEVATSSHAFQIYAGNYYNIIPQLNNMYNQNDYREGQYLIGFNITRLWSF